MRVLVKEAPRFLNHGGHPRGRDRPKPHRGRNRIPAPADDVVVHRGVWDDGVFIVIARGARQWDAERSPYAPWRLQILVASLLAQGATQAFGVPGESFLAVLDAMHDTRDRLQFFICRQEGGAAYMAEAYGKLTGKPGPRVRHPRTGRQPMLRSAFTRPRRIRRR